MSWAPWIRVGWLEHKSPFCGSSQNRFSFFTDTVKSNIYLVIFPLFISCIRLEH